jgi:hypothetical protein
VALVVHSLSAVVIIAAEVPSFAVCVVVTVVVLFFSLFAVAVVVFKKNLQDLISFDENTSEVQFV